MTQLTADSCPSAASVLFNLPDHHVTEVNRDDDGHRLVVISTPVTEAPCPDRSNGGVGADCHRRARDSVRSRHCDGDLRAAVELVRGVDVWIPARLYML